MMIDPLEDRLNRARELGCDVMVNPRRENVRDRVRHETDGRGADVVITACPVAEVQSQAIGLLAPFGRLCLFGGLPNSVGPVTLDTNAIHYGNFLVTGSTGGSVQDYRIALRLVAGKRVDLTRIISDTFPLAELDKAYQTALVGPAGKVVLTAEERP
jgi:L-iditol 2-dehydrogenase